ncbi:cytosolic endo-beta-N-acetylglucosaminidase [Trichonephila inaurata madagascariensis]|uniref:Cytosolic endo-beta-N-acetylglucosaminidase n=1 Tax=Trichonephila inaurata madagascariensis TaxID=2747483 RepID=A0A8X7CK43_9ARAC|nr:cytosolic endo-beta-N-acetylglucosaminidase [Trichonephila inaurata madagascariensis]
MEDNPVQNGEKIKLFIKKKNKEKIDEGVKFILSHLKIFLCSSDVKINLDAFDYSEDKDDLFDKISEYFESKGSIFLFNSLLKNDESSEKICDVIEEECDNFAKEKFIDRIARYLRRIGQGEIEAKKYVKNDFTGAFLSCNYCGKDIPAHENLNINFTENSNCLDVSTIFDVESKRVTDIKDRLQRVILYDYGCKSVVIDKNCHQRNYSFTPDSSCQLTVNRLIEKKVYSILVDITSGEIIHVELKINGILHNPKIILDLINDDSILIKGNTLSKVLRKYFEEDEPEESKDLQDECLPIKCIKDLMNWEPPAFKHATAQLRKRKLDDTHNKILICHDMKGGYLEDRFINGAKEEDCFFFVHWSAVDIFTYFSHHLVSVPPCSWISAAHRNGVQALGTFITEWDEGVEVFEQIFTDKASVHQLCMQLIHIAIFYEFDGWLINIENELKPCQVPFLRYFVKCLTSKMHAYKPGSEVIWYDSVLKNGDLIWQNSLNDLNRLFFLNADAIFLDYHWKEKQMLETVTHAAGRKKDVFVGVDVFGRGDCLFKGGFDTAKWVKEVLNYGLSVGIFAPGWVLECLEPKEIKENQFKFWSMLQELIPPRTMEGLPYCTSFCPGFGKKTYRNGKAVSDEPWINLNLQQPQPIYHSTEENSITICSDDAFNGGGCLCLSGDINSKKGSFEFKILKTFFKLEDTVVISYTFKPLIENADVSLTLHLFSGKEAYKLHLIDAENEDYKMTNHFVRNLSPASMEEIMKTGYKTTEESFEQQTWIKRMYVLSSNDFQNHTIENISVSATYKKSTDKSFSILFGELEILPVFPSYNLSYEQLICKSVSGKPKEISIECILKWKHDSSIFCSDLYLKSADEEKQYICTTNQFYYKLKYNVKLMDEIQIILCPKTAGSGYLPSTSVKIPLKNKN